MKNKVIFFLFFIFIVLSGYFSYGVTTGKLYNEYSLLWEFRMLHPEVLPDINTARISSAGHTTTYADILWIKLIQFIADNLRDGSYHEFLNPIIERITDLHPHFTRAYDLSLNLSPILNPEKPTFESNKEIALTALRIGENGIDKNCNGEILRKINLLDFSQELWETPSLQNPCTDGMLAYNIAYVASEVGAYEKAKEYYKIASTQTDAPAAAKFLGPLMDAKLGDHKKAGERFLFLAIDGYDELPYSCQKIAMNLMTHMRTQSLKDFIASLGKIEEGLVEPKDISNPLATSGTNCYNSVLRALKQFYLGYITEISKDHPNLTTGEELIREGLIESIPSIQSQKNWKLIKKNNLWGYREF